MTTSILVFTIVLSLFKLLVTCLPNDAVKWITKKFEIHFPLNNDNTVATYNNSSLSKDEKTKLVQTYNEAQFIKSQHIFPGNEELFLHPENGTTPIIIDTKKGKKDFRLYMFVYEDHIDVVRQSNKKVIAYVLSSESIQSRAVDSNQVVMSGMEPIV